MMVALQALLLTLLGLLSRIAGMPYKVPLQGSVGGKRTLVILEDMGKVQECSLYFGGLAKAGHELSYHQSTSAELKLKKFGEYLYDNIIMFNANEFNTITFQDISEFVDEGGNVIVAVDSLNSAARAFAEQSGIDFDVKGSAVLDHFSNEPSADPSLLHAGVVSTNAVKSSVVLGSFADLPATKQGVLFRGIGHAVDDKNVLALKVLRGNPTTYSANPAKPIDDYPENAGADTLLATAMQARNNARILFTGSTALFSNAFFRTKLASGELAANEVFCAELSKWVFGQSGVLRFRDITHHKSDGTPPDVILHEKERPDLPQSLYPDPEITRNSLVYRIKDEIVYSMIVEESVNGQWKPFAANDMQMEFVMLDPHVRKTMTSDAKTGRFVASFIAPDNYGVFKFRVLYRRQGYSVLHAETHVSIRPFKHNEYERFIFSAYPYYSSAISALVAFFLFSVAFLGTKEKKG